jgi:hypothetical protein
MPKAWLRGEHGRKGGCTIHRLAGCRRELACPYDQTGSSPVISSKPSVFQQLERLRCKGLPHLGAKPVEKAPNTAGERPGIVHHHGMAGALNAGKPTGRQGLIDHSNSDIVGEHT